MHLNHAPYRFTRLWDLLHPRLFLQVADAELGLFSGRDDFRFVRHARFLAEALQLVNRRHQPEASAPTGIDLQQGAARGHLAQANQSFPLQSSEDGEEGSTLVLGRRSAGRRSADVRL